MVFNIDIDNLCGTSQKQPNQQLWEKNALTGQDCS
jgi:hypothetical protein